VIARRAPVVIPDVREDTPLAAAFRKVAVSQLCEVPAHIRTWMGVPLISRDKVIGVLSFDHSEAGYYTSARAELALAFASQVAVAKENARLYAEAQGKAALEERQKLARELHDSVSQALFGIALGTKTALAQLERDPAQSADPMRYVLNLAEAGLAEMRALIFELRPESLEQEGLKAALAKHAAALRARHNLTVETSFAAEPDLPLSTKEALYRVSQEALHNIVKHAKATKVELALRQDEGETLMSVQDDGAGFDATGSFPGHLGLRSMRERVQALGGQLSLESTLVRGRPSRFGWREEVLAARR
jgi:signal transduction histidine kinase